MGTGCSVRRARLIQYTSRCSAMAMTFGLQYRVRRETQVEVIYLSARDVSDLNQEQEVCVADVDRSKSGGVTRGEFVTGAAETWSKSEGLDGPDGAGGRISGRYWTALGNWMAPVTCPSFLPFSSVLALCSPSRALSNPFAYLLVHLFHLLRLGLYTPAWPGPNFLHLGPIHPLILLIHRPGA